MNIGLIKANLIPVIFTSEKTSKLDWFNFDCIGHKCRLEYFSLIYGDKYFKMVIWNNSILQFTVWNVPNITRLKHKRDQMYLEID